MARIEFGDVRLPERFWSKVIIADNGCWIWKGAKNKAGYGRFEFSGRNRYAFHLAYETLVGQIPIGFEPDHLCRNYGCVNPNHLELVTHKVNCQRGNVGIASGALLKARTHCPQGHPFDVQNTYINPNGSRHCRACDKLRHREARRIKHGG
jgi:hypothetical protein